MTTPMAPHAVGSIAPGTSVAVRTRYTGAWAAGFVVDEVMVPSGGYRVRRLSDQSRVTGVFAASEVRRAEGRRFPSQAAGAPDWPTWHC